MERIKVTPNYSFFRKPLKWLRERKHRKYLEHYLNHPHVRPEMQKKVDNYVRNAILYGGFIVRK